MHIWSYKILNIFVQIYLLDIRNLKTFLKQRQVKNNWDFFPVRSKVPTHVGQVSGTQSCTTECIFYDSNMQILIKTTHSL
jgi:hypothetical protein